MQSTQAIAARVPEPLVVREATANDAPELRRLAQLDTARVPDGRLLVAGDGSELLVAVRVFDGAVVANPFRHTAATVELLRTRAGQLRAADPRRAPRLAARLARFAGRRTGQPSQPSPPHPPGAPGLA